MTEPRIQNHVAFIWSVADLLRGVYKQSEYGKVILPLVNYSTLRKEGRDDGDRFVQVLSEAVINAVGQAAAANVDVQIHEVDGKDICRVHVFPCAHPVQATVTTIDSKGQHHTADRFYVRQGNGTREMNDENERQKYISARWGKNLF